MSIVDKLQTIAKNQEFLYRLGYDKGVQTIFDKTESYNTFWDTFQCWNEEKQQCEREIYRYAFYKWINKYFNPKHIIQPIFAESMLRHTSIDYGAYTDKLDFSKCKNMNACFRDSKDLARLKTIDCRNVNLNGGMNEIFLNCYHLWKIDMFYPSSLVEFNNSFTNCNTLAHITFGSEICVKGLDMKSCICLTKESIKNIINALSPNTNGLSITLSKIAVEREFKISNITNVSTWTEEYRALRSSKLNWSIAYGGD